MRIPGSTEHSLGDAVLKELKYGIGYIYIYFNLMTISVVFITVEKLIRETKIPRELELGGKTPIKSLE